MTQTAAPRLRVLERTDLGFLHRLFNDADVMRYWFEQPHVALATLESTFDERLRTDTARRFVIDVDGRSVGLMELVYIDTVHRNCEFQIIVAPQEQGRGYARAATELALRYAFDTLNLHKVYLLVDTVNAAAIHVYETVGFVVEGVLREEFFVDGTYHDATRMSVLRSEYEQR
ncbi:GNAT family N-acetyltransferase [Gordonia shandongensis]|uniref:GNAT family N-acetyltransferase n=1 Tax=Gordonia shandongensis TaxID=376351 RepID=UPI00047E6074|nr:GNAT family N-acetyltransferase [Gordonia shandongensis]